MRRVMLSMLLLAGAGIAWFVVAWVGERRRKEVFGAERADMLLTPLRSLVHPPGEMIAWFGLRPGDVALEVGPGPGYFSPHAARAVAPGGRLICADLQIAMLRRLRERLGDHAGNVDLVAADAMRLPFKRGVVDAAFLITVLGEVPEPERALRELRRVLRHGGSASFCESFGDPDYVRDGTLRRMCWDANLKFVDRKRQPLGYLARFAAG